MAPPNVGAANAERTLAAIRQLVEDVPREGAWPDEITFKRRGVQPPGQWYITEDDFLQVTVRTTSVTETFTIDIRQLTADGKVCRSSFVFAASGSTQGTTRVFPLAEGFLLSALIQTLGGNGIFVGEAYITLALQTGSGAGNLPYKIIAQGRVGDGSPLWWPEYTGSSVADGGNLASNTSAVPAAGAEISFGGPAFLRCRIQSMQFTLTTSATVANRIPVLTFKEEGVTVYQVAPAAAQTAGTTLIYMCGPGLPSVVLAGGIVLLPLPAGFVHEPSSNISTVTAAIQVGDQYTAMTVYSEQWFDSQS